MKQKDTFFPLKNQVHSLALFVSLALIAVLTSCRPATPDQIPAFRETRVEKRDIEVEDGDTFTWKSQRVRMLGIDCAETSSPFHHGDQEPWGSRARAFLEAQVAGAGELSIIRIEQVDRYGRWLAYLLADGANVNARVIAEGLAYETVSHYGKQGLDRYAEECLRAAQSAPQPQFERPSDFRKRNRKN